MTNFFDIAASNLQKAEKTKMKEMTSKTLFWPRWWEGLSWLRGVSLVGGAKLINGRDTKGVVIR